MRSISLGAHHLKARGNSQAAIARMLGITQQSVSAWLTGRCRPSVELMRRLEILYGIPMRAWTEPAADEVTQ